MKLSDAISQGIAFLAKEQQKDGSFLSFRGKKSYRSTFPTALILSCLASVCQVSQGKKIKDRAAAFLHTQINTHGSVNYWARGSREEKEIPYPDDLDCTFCTFLALSLYDSSSINGKTLASAVTLLTTFEEKEGGPYRTWIVPQKASRVWKDVDVAVNSNIAAFLSLQDITLPRLITFLEKRIDKNCLPSPYYISEYATIYFLSRWYKGERVEKLKAILRERKFPRNPLEVALKVSSLLNLGVSVQEVQKDIEYMISCQSQDHWRTYPFIIEGKHGTQRFFAGSAALTTAFCLEALGKYLQLSQKRIKIHKSVKEKEAARLYNEIIASVKEKLSVFDIYAKKRYFLILHDILVQDKSKQIVLLPYFFSLALGGRKQKIHHKMLITLGVGNVLGWLAYTIYDNFLDEEGDPRDLSCANMCLRELTLIFEHVLPPKTGFQILCKTILDRLESANVWEVFHTRVKIDKGKIHFGANALPNYGDLARLSDRSLGHALTPIALLFALGFSKTSPPVSQVLQFFKHYLIARQLNDDAHDFEKDLKMGHVNAVCAQLLHSYFNKKKIRTRVISVNEIAAGMQKIFWYKDVLGIGKTIRTHIAASKKTVKGMSFMKHPEYLYQLLVPIERSVDKALLERTKTLTFLDAYEK